MTNINIDDALYDDWAALYEKQDKVEYPTLKNFAAKKIREMIEREKSLL